jgi:hypothetical protein
MLPAGCDLDKRRQQLQLRSTAIIVTRAMADAAEYLTAQ